MFYKPWKQQKNFGFKVGMKREYRSEITGVRFAQNYAKIVSFHKIYTPGNLVKLCYFMQ